MNKVNLLVVGAEKSGTTSLHSLLASHSQIYASHVKELFTSTISTLMAIQQVYIKQTVLIGITLSLPLLKRKLQSIDSTLVRYIWRVRIPLNVSEMYWVTSK